MPTLKMHWTPEEEARLKELAAKGYSTFRLAAALNRSFGAIRTKAAHLGVRLPTLKENRDRMRDAERRGTNAKANA